jgi:hypothetical protein
VIVASLALAVPSLLAVPVGASLVGVTAPVLLVPVVGVTAPVLLAPPLAVVCPSPSSAQAEASASTSRPHGVRVVLVIIATR